MLTLSTGNAFHIIGGTSDTWKFTRKGEFPRVFTSRGYVYFRGEDWRKYTEFCVSLPRGNTRGLRKRESPHGETHEEVCNTTCGNTLNPVQKIVR